MNLGLILTKSGAIVEEKNETVWKFYDELTRQFSPSYFGQREKLKFRQCKIVYFFLFSKENR